eukprot:Gb_04796 [translate_table: standard]
MPSSSGGYPNGGHSRFLLITYYTSHFTSWRVGSPLPFTLLHIFLWSSSLFGSPPWLPPRSGFGLWLGESYSFGSILGVRASSYWRIVSSRAPNLYGRFVTGPRVFSFGVEVCVRMMVEDSHWRFFLESISASSVTRQYGNHCANPPLPILLIK